MGGLNAMAPSRSKDIQKIINRALIGGILSCMLRASIAGILYKPTNEFYYGTHSESFGCLIDGNKTKDYNPYGCDLRCIEKFENQEQGEISFFWPSFTDKARKLYSTLISVTG